MAGSSSSSCASLDGLKLAVPMIAFGMNWAKDQHKILFGAVTGYNTAVREGIVQGSQPFQDKKKLWWIRVDWDIDCPEPEPMLMSELNTYREDGIKWIAPGKESAKSKRKRQPAKPKPAKSAMEKGKQARTVRDQTVDSEDSDTSNSDADKDSELLNIAKPREKRTDSEVSPKKKSKDTEGNAS